MYKHRYSSTIPNRLKLERAQMLIGRINKLWQIHA